jgi:hypothetical protein
MDRATEHTEWQWPLSGVYSIMMVKSAQPDEGGGGAQPAHPLSLSRPSSTKLWSILLRADTHTLPLFLLHPYTYIILCGQGCWCGGGGGELQGLGR